MRRLIQHENMVGGCIIGLGVTLCSLPRMHQAGVPLLLYLFSSWILMSIVGAAVCAWGAIDGMRRLCPSRESRPAVLLSVAVLAGLLGAAITAIWIDPLLNEVRRHSEQPLAFQLRFPDSWQGRLALVLWAASFQALFLYAGPMAFFGKGGIKFRRRHAVTGRDKVCPLSHYALRPGTRRFDRGHFAATGSVGRVKVPRAGVNSVIDGIALCVAPFAAGRVDHDRGYAVMQIGLIINPVSGRHRVDQARGDPLAGRVDNLGARRHLHVARPR